MKNELETNDNKFEVILPISQFGHLVKKWEKLPADEAPTAIGGLKNHKCTKQQRILSKNTNHWTQRTLRPVVFSAKERQLV